MAIRYYVGPKCRRPVYYLFRGKRIPSA